MLNLKNNLIFIFNLCCQLIPKKFNLLILVLAPKGKLLVNIRFICHVREVRDLHETRICTINTILEKNNHPSTNTAYVLQYSDTHTR